jgi:hypothetical protein
MRADIAGRRSCSSCANARSSSGHFAEEGATTGRLTQSLKYTLVYPSEPGIADADRVDHHLRSQCVIDRIANLLAAGGVLAIGNQNDRLSAWLLGEQVS